MARSPLVFQKFRFNVYGQKPVHSRTKETLNTNSLVGWLDYTEEERATGKSKEANTIRDDGWLGYTMKNERTYTNIGWLTKENQDEFQQMLTNAFSKDKDVFYDTVVSMKDYELAYSNGFKTIDDYVAVYRKIMPSFFRKVGFEPDNMIWWVNYHENTDNPHCHVTFLEKTKTREKLNFTPKELSMWKMSVTKEMGLREVFENTVGEKSVSYFKAKDQDKAQVIRLAQEMMQNPKLTSTLENLYRVLPKTGRLLYGSKNMLPYKKMIDEIITELLNEESIRFIFEQYLEKCETLDAIRNQANKTKSTNIKDAELKKLYREVGNIILSNHKKGMDLNEKFENKIKGKQIVLYPSRSLLLYDDDKKCVYRLPRKKDFIVLDKNDLAMADGEYVLTYREGTQFKVYHDENIFKTFLDLANDDLDEYLKDKKSSIFELSDLFKSFHRGFILSDEEIKEYQVNQKALSKKQMRKKYNQTVYQRNYKQTPFSEAKLRGELMSLVTKHELEVNREIDEFLNNAKDIEY